MKIALIGDVHGHKQKLYDILRVSAQKYHATAAVQTGDFGFKADEQIFHDHDHFAIPLHVICGNHEDFVFLKHAVATGLINQWKKKNLFYQPRSSVANFGDQQVGFIGGALNIHKGQKRHHGNVISHDDISSSVISFNLHQPSIVVAHSCPSGIGIGMKSNPRMYSGVIHNILFEGYDPGPANDCGENALSTLWKKLEFQPRLWCFGHFHKAHQTQIGNTLFLALPSLEKSDQIYLWDTETSVLEHWPL